ncbi:MAG: thioredoxin-disulfide reductase, partial [Clostridia bacterium]|nr:thioredoxin-disulfide reductase [Clostridia bacterium]
MDFDVIIIGGGPGGLSCALYTARANLKTLVLEGTGIGGQVNYTYEVDNYLGFSGTGAELSEKMKAQVEKFDVTFLSEKVREIADWDKDMKTVKTRRNTYRAKAIVIATGANPRLLGVDGEERLKGAGVSYCATCDGAFFKDKTVMVVGGGNTALEDAVYLSKFCPKVHLVHRRDGFRANAMLLEKVKNSSKILVKTNAVVDKIQGENAVKSVVLRNTLSSKISVVDTDAVFVAIGRNPETSLACDKLSLDDAGYIITDENMRTNIPGVYAIGDVRNTPLRQIVTAAADG